MSGTSGSGSGDDPQDRRSARNAPSEEFALEFTPENEVREHFPRSADEIWMALQSILRDLYCQEIIESGDLDLFEKIAVTLQQGWHEMEDKAYPLVIGFRPGAFQGKRGGFVPDSRLDTPLEDMLEDLRLIAEEMPGEVSVGATRLKSKLGKLHHIAFADPDAALRFLKAFLEYKKATTLDDFKARADESLPDWRALTEEFNHHAEHGNALRAEMDGEELENLLDGLPAWPFASQREIDFITHDLKSTRPHVIISLQRIEATIVEENGAEPGRDYNPHYRMH